MMCNGAVASWNIQLKGIRIPIFATRVKFYPLIKKKRNLRVGELYDKVPAKEELCVSRYLAVSSRHISLLATASVAHRIKYLRLRASKGIKLKLKICRFLCYKYAITTLKILYSFLFSGSVNDYIHIWKEGMCNIR